MLRHTTSSILVLGTMSDHLRSWQTVRDVIARTGELNRDQVRNALRALHREGIVERTESEPHSYRLHSNLSDVQRAWIKEALEKRSRRSTVIHNDAVSAEQERIAEPIQFHLLDEHLCHEALRGDQGAMVFVARVRPEVTQWLAENIEGDWYPLTSPSRLAFLDATDATLFMLRWG